MGVGVGISAGRDVAEQADGSPPAPRPTAPALAGVERAGAGDPVVFLHAVGLDLTWWDTVLARLAPDLPFVALDLPGHGLSPRLEHEFSLGDLAEIVHADLARRGHLRFHLCGHSVGGMVAQALAVAHPGAVASLTLIATAATYDETVRAILRDRAAGVATHGMAPLVGPTLDRWFTTDFRRRHPEVVARCGRTLRAADAANHARMWRAIAELDLVGGLRGLQRPTQVLVGEVDGATPPTAARLITDAVPGARLTMLPAVAHMATVEAAEAVAAAIASFFRN
jgi:3-oxoadipate enol-lactonase